MQQIVGSGKSFLPMSHIPLTKWTNSGINKGVTGGGEELRPAQMRRWRQTNFTGKYFHEKANKQRFLYVSDGCWNAARYSPFGRRLR